MSNTVQHLVTIPDDDYDHVMEKVKRGETAVLTGRRGTDQVKLVNGNKLYECNSGKLIVPVRDILAIFDSNKVTQARCCRLSCQAIA